MFFLIIFFQKSLFTENYFLIAAINLAARGPLYTCLVLTDFAITIRILSSKRFQIDLVLQLVPPNLLIFCSVFLAGSSVGLSVILSVM